MSILNHISDKSLGTIISQADPEQVVEILEACVGNLSELHDVDVSDLETAIENLEFTREYDVAVTITYDVCVRVIAKSEEDAERIINDEITTTEIINQEWNEYVESIDIQHINQEIHEVEEA